jgi:hypothetical protein
VGIDPCYTFRNVRRTATRLVRSSGVKWRDERSVCRVICCSDKLFRNSILPTFSVSLQEIFLFSVLELYLYTGIVLHIRVHAHTHESKMAGCQLSKVGLSGNALKVRN